MENYLTRWQLQEAKARLSEVVQSAERDGPQEITLRGRSAAVVVSKRDFTRMTGRKPSLVQFLRQSPLAKVELRIGRSRSLAREVEL